MAASEVAALLIIEFLIFISTILPVFHMINALITAFRRKQILPFSEAEEKFSILIPCYNEELLIEYSINNMINLNYKNYEVIYINDGSSDDTMEKLNEALKLKKFYYKSRYIYQSSAYKNFYVINNSNMGKGESLNVGIKFASSPLIVTLDADSSLHKDALKYMNRAFIDKDIVAAGGAIHIIQGYEKKQDLNIKRITTLQILDYIKGFYIYKISLHKQNATAIISGAFGAFRKDILMQVGGYRKTLGEDIDITLKIQFMIKNTDKKILYMPEALCYTQCPENWKDLFKQRLRWQKGFINCFLFYKNQFIKNFLNKSLSFHFFVESLLMGITSIFFSIFTFIILLIVASSAILKIYIFYLAIRIILRELYSLAAIFISKRYNLYPKETYKEIYKIFILDILVYPLFLMCLYVCGTFMYFWNSEENQMWNKMRRTQNFYKMSEQFKNG